MKFIKINFLRILKGCLLPVVLKQKENATLKLPTAKLNNSLCKIKFHKKSVLANRFLQKSMPIEKAFKPLKNIEKSLS